MNDLNNNLNNNSSSSTNSSTNWMNKYFIKSIKRLFNKVGSFAFGFGFAVSLLAGAVYAWNAVWHGTDWIQPGAVIDGQKVAENMEWLKQKVDTASGSWEYLTVHSQSTEIPACPDGWEKVSDGYSHITSHNAAVGGILDLALPQSCVQDLIPLRVIECFYNGCNYGTGGDFSIYLAVSNLNDIGFITSIPDIKNMISRCSICRKKSTKVLAFHSMTNTPPSCPAGSNLLWTGYSLNSVTPHSGYEEMVTDISSPGSCIKNFKDLPFVECRLGGCEYVTPGDYSSYLTATTIDTGYMPTQQAIQYISRCSVCEFK